MLLAAAFVSYAGPFTSKFRAGLIKEWIKFLMDKGAPMTPGISDPLKVGFTSNSITAAGQASLPHALSVTTSPKSIMVMPMVMNAASVLRTMLASFQSSSCMGLLAAALQVLVDDATVASWVREGLPSDPTSVQNGTILTNSERWPLMMDPQLQARCYAPPERTWPALTASLAFGCAGVSRIASSRLPAPTGFHWHPEGANLLLSKVLGLSLSIIAPASLQVAAMVQGVVWIKERESKHNLQVVRMGAAGTVTAMERAIEAGHSVLVENMGESIDAVLNPVITRSTFKKVGAAAL